MPKEVRVWRITSADTLVEVKPVPLALESRLEIWLQKDIGILSDDLLVIGRQVPTAYGGIIDLLCLDRIGDATIVELKRDKTPREITAQALDYASWVRTLSHEDITQIAGAYLTRTGADLAGAFHDRFGIDLPDVLNEDHSIIIVAATIDSSSERIISYLSDAHGVRINAATFHYFREDVDGAPSERLVRVFLLEPETVEHRSVQRGSSKRKPPPTLEEYDELVEHQGVAEMYRPLLNRLGAYFSIYPMVTLVAFYGPLDGGHRALFSIYPADSSRNEGLHFTLYLWRLAKFLAVEPDEIRGVLPNSLSPWKYVSTSDQDGSGVSGYFTELREVTAFIDFVERKRDGMDI